MKKELTKEYIDSFNYNVVLTEYEASFDIFEEEDNTRKAYEDLSDIKEWVENEILTPKEIIIKRNYNVDPPITTILLYLKHKEDYERVINQFGDRVK